MRFKLLLLTTVSGMFTGCGQQLPTVTDATTQETESSKIMTAEEQAENEIYLGDLEDSAAEDESASEEVDASIEKDIEERRLQQMVDMVMSKQDADESGDLSLEEFLARPSVNAEEKEFSEEQNEKMLTVLTKDFEKYAGEDELLSTEELKTLLKAMAPRIGRHRHQKFPGQHEARVKKTWKEITEEYDADGDGLLSEEEFAKIEADRAAPGPMPRPGRHMKYGHVNHGPRPDQSESQEADESEAQSSEDSENEEAETEADS